MAERRRGPKPRPSIGQIMDGIQREADDMYHGEVGNNILSLFNRLPTDDKRTFLRSALVHLWKDQIQKEIDGRQDVCLDEEILINRDQVDWELKDIHEKNYQEQAHLKMWFTKVFFTFAVLLFVGVIVVTYMVDGSSETTGLALKHFERVLKLLL